MRQQRTARSNVQRQPHLRRSAWPVAAWVVTLALHLGVLAFMLRTPTPLLLSRADANPDSTDALQVRFIEAAGVPPARARVIPRLAPPPRLPSPTRAAKSPALKAVVSKGPASPPLQTSAAPQDQPSPAPGPAYVEGGSDFAQRLRDANRPAVRLPGELNPHVPRFRMANPNRSALRSVLNVVKGAFGGADVACLDAESADGLTPQQQLAEGMSMRDIKRTAAAHGCVPLDRLRSMKKAPMAAPTLR